MALENTVIGSTLSQTALAVHFKRSTKWIRKQGEFVTDRASHLAARWEETWSRMEFRDKRCAGYKRIS